MPRFIISNNFLLPNAAVSRRLDRPRGTYASWALPRGEQSGFKIPVTMALRPEDRERDPHHRKGLAHVSENRIEIFGQQVDGRWRAPARIDTPPSAPTGLKR